MTACGCYSVRWCTVAETASLSDRRQNITVTVNSTAAFTCATRTADPIRWKRLLLNSTQFITIFTGTKQNPKFPRFTVKTNEITTQGELVIYNVKYKDAGTFFCDLANGTIISYFTLTVTG